MHVQVARNLCFVPTLSLKSAFRGPLSRLRRATYELRFCLNSCPNYGVSCFTRLNFATQPKLRDHSVAAGPTLVFNGDIGTWSLLAACASLAQIAEQRTPLGKNLSASVLALLAALCLACLGLLPSQAPAYEVVTSVFLPLASVLFVLEIQFGRLGGPEVVTLASFSVGVVGTILGTIVAWLLLGPKLGQEGWKLAGALCATYIGGSVNFAATAQVLGMRSGVAPAMAADNIAMAAYLAALSAVPVKPSGWGNGSTAEPKREGPPRLTSSWRRLSLCVGFGMAMLAAGTALAEVLGLPTLGIALSTLLASLASGSINARAGQTPFKGAQQIGGVLLLFFFATVGAEAGSLESIARSGWVLAFVAVQLIVHLGIIIGAGRAFRWPMEAVLTASNANIGGSGTAVAMAFERGWPAMVRPALLAGSAGYAIGTIVGLVMAHVLGPN